MTEPYGTRSALAQQNRRDYFRAWSAAKRMANQTRIDVIKLAAGCTDCGYRGHPAALDFDHTDPSTKTLEISRALARPWSRLEEEIALCQIRCANCHRIRSHRQRWGTHVRRSDSPIRRPQVRGSQVSHAKLTEETAATILTRVAAGEMQRDLAVEYGVGKASIYNLISGRTWKHVLPEMPRRTPRSIKGRAECRQGHPMSGTNLFYEEGHPRCRACNAAYAKAWRDRKREVVPNVA